MSHGQSVCVVTGGSLGIGLAVCHTFSENDYRVINLDVRDFDDTPINAEWVACDVSNMEQVRHAIDHIAVKYGRIDALVCNAGMHVSATIEDTDEALLDKVMSLNIKGAYGAIKASL